MCQQRECVNNMVHIVRDVSLSKLSIFNERVQVLGLLVHIISPTRSRTISCFICIQTW
jgi:hypothetical protein